MYLWRTAELAASLKARTVSQSELKNYYISTGVLHSISMAVALLEPVENLAARTAEILGPAVATVIGLDIVFRTNGGTSGHEYLNRVVALSFPLLIKTLVAGFALAVPLEAIYSLGQTEILVSWIYAAATTGIAAIFMWRLNVHVRDIVSL